MIIKYILCMFTDIKEYILFIQLFRFQDDEEQLISIEIADSFFSEFAKQMRKTLKWIYRLYQKDLH